MIVSNVVEMNIINFTYNAGFGNSAAIVCHLKGDRIVSYEDSNNIWVGGKVLEQITNAVLRFNK